MTDHHATSEAEEMYLITVARAIEDGVEPPVPVSEISGALEVSAVSANQMIKKLEGAGLVSYEPYKGVTLTDSGDELANTVLRSRRLWGRFLADHLGLSPAKADEVACDMEHVTPNMVADRLAAFLGDPATGPTGKPIPQVSGLRRPSGVPLGDLGVGEQCVVVSVDSSSEGFLRTQGIDDGAQVAVTAKGADGSILIIGADGPVHLSADLAAGVIVER